MHSRKLTQIANLILILLSLSGCGRGLSLRGGQLPYFCTHVFAYGLRIKVTNPVDVVSLNGLKIEVKDGSWIETFEIDANGVIWEKRGNQSKERVDYPSEDGFQEFWAAGERPGSYEVNVTHPTLSAVLKKTVAVTQDGCHVTPASVDFELK